MIKATSFIAFALSSTSIAAPNAASPEPSAAHFDELKTLVGVWRQADRPSSPLRVRFSLTAGGTVLMEEWLRGSQHHSLTLYHRDGNRTIATHYCPQGNQPRLVLTRPANDRTLRFSFADATDLDSERESHVVALSFDLSDRERIVRSETYREAGNEEASDMQLVREL